MHYSPYKAMQNPKVLVIGSGGGRDVVAALVSGSKDVTSVEINPLIYNIVRSYGAQAGNVYEHAFVRSYVEEGRSFITRSLEKYDVIYIPFVDTWASVSTGGLGVSENFLYTTEAFQEYYEHLTDTGKIVTVRWLIDTPRFVSTYIKLMEDNGIPREQVSKHLIIVTAESFDSDPSGTMVVFSKSPFTEEEVDYYSTFFLRHGYKPILIPGQIGREPYSEVLSGKITLQEFHEKFPTKADFVVDDSPYFLSYEKPMPAIVQYLLQGSVIIAAIFVAMPLTWLWRSSFSHERKTPQIGIASIVPYFASLGLGFILVELALLQKLTLMLGNPTTTFAILLFTLLLSGGFGSNLSSKILRNGVKRLPFLIAGLVALGSIYALVMPSVVSAVIPQPFETKVAISVLILAPIGLLMGMPLPTGIRILKSHGSDYIPWMWAINGAFSVLGAVLAVAIGITQGASYALLVGILVYLIPLGVSLNWRTRSLMKAEGP
jgi:hypothetical protein